MSSAGGMWRLAIAFCREMVQRVYGVQAHVIGHCRERLAEQRCARFGRTCQRSVQVNGPVLSDRGQFQMVSCPHLSDMEVVSSDVFVTRSNLACCEDSG